MSHHNFKHHHHHQQRRNKAHDKSAVNKLTSVLSSLNDKPKFDHEEPPKNALEGWQRLVDGNKRFASGNLTEYFLHLAHEIDPERRKELGLGQHPFAVILTCSDSRVAPELIFDQGLGDVFVVRTAGNVPDNVALGSIEYGVLHLKASLLIVLGHEKCGAVTATLDHLAAAADPKPKANEPNASEKTHIGSIVAEIAPSAAGPFKKYGNTDNVKSVHSAVKKNANAIGKILPERSPALKRVIEEGNLSIITAVYDLDTGFVKLLTKTGKH